MASSLNSLPANIPVTSVTSSSISFAAFALPFSWASTTWVPLLPSRYSEPLTCYGWRFYDSDQVKIDTFCGVFDVSRSAAAIRLEQLGYLNRKKDYEYRDPLEVWPWAGISEYRNHLRKCRLKSSGQRMQSLRKSPGLSGALIADTIQSRTVLHPPCQHGLSSDGQWTKQGESQKWSSEHYFGAVYDCEENLIVLCVWKWQNRDTTCPLRCNL